MRFKIYLFLAFFATSAVSAQLYDNRNRYLQSPHSYNRFAQELDGPPKKPAKKYTPSRTTSSRNSYNYYRNRVNRYSRAYLTTDDFYRRFRDPNVHRRFSSFIGQENSLTINLNRNPEKSLNFQCFCFVPIDINSLFNFYSSIDSEIKANRERIINKQEQEYSKEMSNRGFSKNYGETFKDQQKRFFNRYVQTFNSGYEQGRKTSYRDHKERLVNELKYTAERFDNIFEKEIAVNVVFDFLKSYKSNPRNTAKPKKYVGDLKIGQQFLYDIPSSNYNNYNIVKLFLRTGNRSALEQLAVRNTYHNIRNSNNLNDYLTDRYIKQYDNEYDLNKRFAFQSAYLVDYLAGHQLTPLNKNQINNKYDFSGYMPHVKYDRNKIMNFYKNNSTANSGYSMSFEKAKAIMAFNGFPSLVKRTIEVDGNIKNSVMNYLSNAVPMNYELNTIRDAINSRYNDAFKWSELPYFRTRSFQKRESPETIMSIYLEKTDFNYFFLNQYGLDGSLILDLGPTRYTYKMHKGIGDVLKKMYNNPIYAGKEGATIRHFLKEKGLNVPSSLSNRDLGKLFDFGGGNSNTLTIKFSDYARKYITNFHHGDGKYGTSLFTDLLKLKKLHDILKGRPVDFDDQIIDDELTGKAKCVYDMLKNTSVGFKKMIKKFDGDFPVSHLKLTVGVEPRSPNANAVTYPPVDYITEIKINPNKLNRPNLSIARTFVHEVIHAEMFRKLLSLSSSNGQIDVINLRQMLQRGDYPGIFDYYTRFGVNGFQHEQMAAHYRNTIVEVLKVVQPGLSNNIYNSLAWAGLHGTTAWNNLSNEERRRIQRTYSNFDNNGSENCN